MAKLKLHDQYTQEVSEVSDNILVLDSYINTHSKIRHQCSICNHIWEATPHNILSGKTGCPCCDKTERYFDDIKYKQMLSGKSIINLEPYINSYSKILHQCLICGYRWKRVPMLYNSCGCPCCSRHKASETRALPLNEFLNRLENIHAHSIHYIGGYKMVRSRVNVKCKKCGLEWNPLASALLQSQGCPHCNISKGEKLIESILIKNGIKFNSQKTFDGVVGIGGGKLKYDFYLHELNVCIEFDGIQHFKPIFNWGGEDRFKLTIHHDNIKNEYCKANNIGLIRISYLKETVIINDNENVQSILNILKFV